MGNNILDFGFAHLLAGKAGENGTIVIPENYTTIESDAFSDVYCSKIVVGENIKNIAPRAFRRAMVDVIDLSKCKITSLPEEMFKNSIATEIILPDSLVSIGKGAFNSCHLQKIVLPQSVKIIDEEAFYYCRGLKSITIPDGVFSIGMGAFRECSQLSTVNLPNSLRTIEANTFSNCVALKEITIPDSVASIEPLAFCGCKQLEKIYLSQNLKYIGQDAFKSCTSLKKIEFPQSLEHICSDAFAFCTELKSLTIPKKVKVLGGWSFFNCLGLEKVDLGNVEEIGEEAFALTNIRDLILPNSVKVIGRRAFGDSNIEHLYLPEGIQKIGDYAFQQNNNLEYVDIPDSVTELGDFAFDGCANLKGIKFPNSLKILQSQGDLGLVEHIDLPSHLEVLGYRAFVDSIYLRDIKIPETVKKIGELALANTGIENIQLPKNLLSIGAEAFAHCSQLREIEFPEKVDEINAKLFEDCVNLKTVKFNDSIKFVRNGAFKNCTSLTSLEFPKSVKFVGEHVFDNCENLEKIVFNGSAVFNNSFTKLSPKTKLISFGEGSELKGEMKINPLKYYTKKQGKIYLTTQPMDETSFCFGDLTRQDGVQPRFDYVFGMFEERENFKKLFKECPMCIDLFNLLVEVKGISWFKDFYNENKDNFKFFKQCAKLVPKGLEEEFCKLYYDLGGFERNYTSVKKDKDGKDVIKTTNYSQKVGEFLKAMLTEEPWFFDKAHLQGLLLSEFKEDFSNFILNKENFLETIHECKGIPEFFVKFYNEFEQSQMLNTSNKGSQRQLKPTVKSFKKYMFSNSFKGATEHFEIAYALQQFYTDQATFDEAVAIDNERISKNVPNDILKTHIAGFKKIDELAEKIRSEAGSAMRTIIDITDKLSYEFLSKDDPNNFVLGKLVNCCAHLEGVGYGIMHASITHPDVQNLVIRTSSGKIIAKSTLYVNREKGYGVFNNVEINSNIQDYQKEEIYEAYIKAVNEFATAYNHENPDNPLKIITVGANLNDLNEILKDKNKVSTTNYEAINYGKFGKDGRVYSGDSSYKQYVLWEKEEQDKPISMWDLRRDLDLL